jgi:four helix bundle protein
LVHGQARTLVAWQRSQVLAVQLYRLTASWPISERYGLTAQVRRAAVSVPTNIAEGAGRYGRAEFGRYLDIAMGSLGEVASLLALARDLGFISEENFVSAMEGHDDASRLVALLRRAVRRTQSQR